MQRYWEMFSSPEMIYRLFYPTQAGLSDLELAVRMVIEKFPTDGNILFAYYMYEDYSGRAFVLYRRKRLFEVHGSHCSCEGLKGSWRPEPTTWAALAMRQFSYLPDDPRQELEDLIKKRGSHGAGSSTGEVRR